MIEAAAAGDRASRDDFGRVYSPVVRSYLAHRWRGGPHTHDVEDAAQEVFLECFKRDGLLERADPDRAGGFRAFLYGVTRNIALRVEADRARREARVEPLGEAFEEPEDTEARLSRLFDRSWATALLREATRLQEERARGLGEEAVRRAELLRLRFHDGQPIRDIAAAWQVDAAVLHHDYARAREEFRQALFEVVAFHHPGTRAEVEAECAGLFRHLQ